MKLIRARDQKAQLQHTKLNEKINNPDYIYSSEFSKEKKAHFIEICSLQEQILNNLRKLEFCDPLQVFQVAMNLAQFAHLAR